MRIVKYFLPFLFALSLMLPALGCQQEGPAEKAGKQIDEAVEKGSEKASEAWDAAKDKAEELKKKE